MQQEKPLTEENLTIHQKGGRALRDKKPPDYFSKLINKRWSKYSKTKGTAKKRKAKK